MLTLLTALALTLPPDELVLQGRLAGAPGASVDGTYGLRVALYAGAEGGSPVFEQEFAAVAVVDGVLSVTATGVAAALGAGPRFVELSVDAEPPLPRVALSPVPYAHVAVEALGLSCTGCVSVEALADGSVTAPKLGISCGDGEVLKFGAAGWACGADLAYWEPVGLGDLARPTGRVGIGTLTPQTTLDVAGAVRLGMEVPCGLPQEGALRYNPTEKNVEFCDGVTWRPLYEAPNGQFKAQPGASCKAILASGYSVGDAIYWLDPNGGPTADAFQTYCDMTTDGGGWTLLGTVAGGDANNWNAKFGLWTDESTVGTAGAAFSADFKAPAWSALPITEVLYQRRYSGVRKASVRIKQACLFGRATFRELFVSYDTSLRCPVTDLVVVQPPTDAVGVTDANYMEGVGNGLGGPDTNGWCWNGGDTDTTTFSGHAGWNQSGYTTCLAAGHLGYVGVFESGSTQFHNWDIDTTNWLYAADTTKIAISYFGR